MNTVVKRRFALFALIGAAVLSCSLSGAQSPAPWSSSSLRRILVKPSGNPPGEAPVSPSISNYPAAVSLASVPNTTVSQTVASSSVLVYSPISRPI